MKDNIAFYCYNLDKVIDGFVVQAETSYRYTLENLYPLMDRLEIQRSVITDISLYKRL